MSSTFPCLSSSFCFSLLSYIPTFPHTSVSLLPWSLSPILSLSLHISCISLGHCGLSSLSLPKIILICRTWSLRTANVTFWQRTVSDSVSVHLHPALSPTLTHTLPLSLPLSLSLMCFNGTAFFALTPAQLTNQTDGKTWLFSLSPSTHPLPCFSLSFTSPLSRTHLPTETCVSNNVWEWLGYFPLRPEW